MSYIGNPLVTQAFLTDQFNGDNTTTAFTLSTSPANPASILVSVSGVLQDPTTYSISGRTLNFSGAPPVGTGYISIRYLGIPASGVTTTAYRTITEYTATAGQTTFTPPSYTVGFIAVYRNGVRLGAADFTATNGTSVVLASAATLGDLVVTESYYVSSVLNAIPATANAITSLYISANAVTQTAISSGVAGTGPAFSAYSTSNQSISATTNTKITFDTEEFDTNNNFASSRFTPTVAGYYFCTATVRGNAGNNELNLGIWRNGGGGSNAKQGTILAAGATGTTCTAMFYMNGTTDYLEVYLYCASTCTTSGNQSSSYFQGTLVRAA